MQRIKHALPDPGWPTRDAASDAMWFQPITLGNVRLPRRTWIPAMVPWRSTLQGEVTPAILQWYGRFAQGHPGGLVVEATGIRDVPSGPLLRIGHDRYVNGLRQLVDEVRERSQGETKLFIQLIDFLNIRRRPTSEKFFDQFLYLTDHHRAAVPSARDDNEVRAALKRMDQSDLREVLTAREFEALMLGLRERVTDTELPHIRDLPRALPSLFAAAARRACEAGFDGVELHYAHAYTMASMLSRLNDRADGYGTTREGRVRLAVEVMQAVRSEVGTDIAVGCRMLTEECIPGGSSIEDSQWFGLRFAEVGMDFLSLSRGGKFEDAQPPKVGQAAYPYTGQSGYECMPTVRSDELGPFGRNVSAASTMRRHLRAHGFSVPIIVSGGICSFTQAETILQAGKADVVGAARQSLADPDWFRKIELGLGTEIRRCKFTNYCEALDQHHKAVTCQLWDRSNLDEPDILLSDDGRRRLTAPRWNRRPAEQTDIP